MITRRNVTKGAAWAVPAITVAAAAPSLAASGSPATPTGEGYKCPGNADTPKGWPMQGYLLVMHGVVGTPDIAHIEQGNGKTPEVAIGPTPLGGGSWEWVLDAKSSPSSLIVTLVGHSTVTIPVSPHCPDRS